MGSTQHVSFNTSKTERWETDSRRCHINWVVLDSDWEAEFCRVVEGHPQVKAYVKNHNLGLEVPYQYGSISRTYIPDFIVLVDDGQGSSNVAGARDGGSDRGHGDNNLLHLIVEIKGYRREDAKVKKTTMDTYWVPGVNHLKKYGRWAFAEFGDVFQMESDFGEKIAAEFDRLMTAQTNKEGI